MKTGDRTRIGSSEKDGASFVECNESNYFGSDQRVTRANTSQSVDRHDLSGACFLERIRMVCTDLHDSASHSSPVELPQDLFHFVSARVEHRRLGPQRACVETGEH